MSENRYYTTVPIIGRILAEWGLDSNKDSHGNELWGSTAPGATLSLKCTNGVGSRKLNLSEAFEHDKTMAKAMAKAIANDPLSIVMDNIDLGELESPLKVLCEKSNTTPSQSPHN